MLELPDVIQPLAIHGGLSVLRMVLFYYGIYVEPEQTTGLDPRKMVQFCRGVGLDARLRTRLTIDDLKRWLHEQIPVIVMYQAWSDEPSRDYREKWSSGHYSVVVGFRGSMIILKDPNLYGLGFIPIEQFVQRWHLMDVNGHRYEMGGIPITGHTVIYNRHQLTSIQ